jgi:hypothetical protein
MTPMERLLTSLMLAHPRTPGANALFVWMYRGRRDVWNGFDRHYHDAVQVVARSRAK